MAFECMDQIQKTHIDLLCRHGALVAKGEN